MTLSTRLSHGFRHITYRTARAGGALVAAAALVGALGCGGDDSTGPGGVAGKYNIVSVTGPQGTDNTAPFTMLTQDIDGVTYRVDLMSGFVNLTSDGHYSGDGSVNIYADGVLVGSDDSFGDVGSGGGTYTVSGSTITFTPSDGSSPVTASYTGGNTITITETEDDPDLGTLSFTIVAKKS